MENNIKLSLEQISDMKHCIGYQINNKPKRGILNAYRNYYTTGVEGIKRLDELVEIGFMKQFPFSQGGKVYRVTNKGIEYLEQLLSIKIKQDKEDIVEVE